MDLEWVFPVIELVIILGKKDRNAKVYQKSGETSVLGVVRPTNRKAAMTK